MDPSVLAFGAYFANSVIQFADGYLTAEGISHKLVESNGITAKLMKKIGITATNAIKIGAVPMVSIIVDLHSGYPGLLNGLIAAATLYPVIHNVRLLRKNKISIF